MRLSLEVKKLRGEPVRLLVDFLRLWYSEKELPQRQGSLSPEAQSECETLAHAPENGVAWNRRAMMLYRVGRLTESLAALEKAVELEPDNSEAWSNLGVARSSLGRYEEALGAFDKSFELDPEPRDFHRCSNYAVILCELNRWKEGTAALVEAFPRLSEKGGRDLGGEIAIVRNLLIRTQDAMRWGQFVQSWIELFGRYELLAALGQGLVRSIRILEIPWISNEVANAWNLLWQDLGGGHQGLDVALRLLGTAVKYRMGHDRRVLFELALEERQLLEPLLGIREEEPASQLVARRKSRRAVPRLLR
ncbi:MAG: tetratricopeptide repeat protein [Deltaproteobacteria bacterium]|nr:tetratricopeptide repeat protein [Deltaproteobacteria bacterium]